MQGEDPTMEVSHDSSEWCFSMSSSSAEDPGADLGWDLETQPVKGPHSRVRFSSSRRAETWGVRERYWQLETARLRDCLLQDLGVTV